MLGLVEAAGHRLYWPEHFECCSESALVAQAYHNAAVEAGDPSSHDSVHMDPFVAADLDRADA